MSKVQPALFPKDAFPSVERTPRESIDDALLEICSKVTGKRAKIVIQHILQHGLVTTEELQEVYKYDHAPRAIRDVRENGVPLVTKMVTSPNTGSRMAAYVFDDVSKIKRGRIGGRQAFPKAFKDELVETYGARDAVTGEAREARYLQIDHRVPYEIAAEGGATANSRDAADYMLLDAGSNRQKSWSCEHCENFEILHDPEICKRCFWAFPEDYEHIAMRQERRLDIVWSGAEAADHDALVQEAEANGISPTELAKRRIAKRD